MEGNPVRKSLACFAAVALIVTVAGNANAALTKADNSCRAAIQKNGSKLGSTTFKTLIGCVKSQLGGKIAASTDVLDALAAPLGALLRDRQAA